MNVSTIGFDIAKRVFQVHGIDSAGQVMLRRQLRRSEVIKLFRKLPPCVVGMEACASAHYWGREIAALGHTVRLMPPTRVKPYVTRGRKNDRADAAAYCEAVTWPGAMQHQGRLLIDRLDRHERHRRRQSLIEQRTRLRASRSHGRGRHHRAQGRRRFRGFAGDVGS
jgi:transposase